MQVEYRTALAEVRGDELEYVISDESKDRHGTIIKADGWQLGNFRKNPIALFNHDPHFIVGAWKNLRIEAGKLIGRLSLLPAGVSSRLDEIRAAAEARVLRGVSVGFRLLESDGNTYTKMELLEVSLVSIPSNPNALAMARSLHLSDDAKNLIFGEPAGEGEALRLRLIGESAAKAIPSKARQMTLTQRVEAAQASVTQARDALTEHIGNDDADHETTEALTAEVERQEHALESLKRAERALAIRSAEALPVATTAVTTTVRKPFAAPKREVKPSDLLIRAASVHAVAMASGRNADDVLMRMYGDDEPTGIVTRAAIAGATTTTAGWAAELVNTVMTDFLETLRPLSVYPALAAAGGGRLAFGPNAGAIKIPSRASTPSIGGSFVGEGSPIPVRRLGLTSVTLTPKKMAVISVFSREIARYGTPAIETLIRNEILFDTAITLDSLLLDATAGSAVRPAGLLNGVSALTATAGGGYAAILGDIKKLRAPFDAANAGDNLVLLMNPAQQESLGLTPGADGTLGWAADIIARYRIMVSTGVPAGDLIMIRAADFATATGDTPEFDVSQEATIHMEDTTPLQIATGAQGAGVLATPTQSMFQTAQIAVRMLMDVSWAMRRTGMVQWIDNVTW